MSNRFPITVNVSTNRLEELPASDNIDLTSSGIYDGTGVGNSGQVLSSTGESVQWANPFSGSYTDLTNKPIIPTAYELPAATTSTLGGVKVGDGLSITEAGVLSATGGGGAEVGLASRTTASGTTTSVNDGTAVNLDIASVAKSYGLLKIKTSHAAWVTLYVNKAARTADASRSETTDPLPGSGVLAEVITTAAGSQVITPGVYAWSEDSGTNTEINSDAYGATDTVYLKVVNKSGAAAAVTITLSYVSLEA